ncbi:MAG: hypothetical protein DI626_06085 [Micavibrio aeruginosavorus]|uniref:Uncharacterized protein n=1 Tax=Micavibrio aeruginosavorus TaxID=349221 RepID=A0A2W5BY06_9BACT|nr:MAG: hypothetical protein DI626_06085 [Micavibrio aeruginosavorus]
MSNINVFEFSPAAPETKHVASVCGIHVSPSGPYIHLFEIEENAGGLVSENILTAAKAARDYFFPNHGLSDINWQFVKGPWITPVTFNEKNGLCTKITFQNGSVHDGIRFNRMLRGSVENYETMIGNKSVIETFAQGDKLYEGGSREFYPVLTPDAPGGNLYYKATFDSDHMRNDFEIIIADSTKVRALWERQSTTLEQTLCTLKKTWEEVNKETWATGYDAILHQSSRETSAQHLRGSIIGRAIEMPYISYGLNRERPLQFSNGRHRLFNPINCGAPFVPVEMYKTEGTEIFKEICGWKIGAAKIAYPNMVAKLDRFD